MLLEERLPEPPPELEPPELFLEFEPVAITELDDVAGLIVAVEDIALGVEGVATAGAAGATVVVVVTLSILCFSSYKYCIICTEALNTLS